MLITLFLISIPTLIFIMGLSFFVDEHYQKPGHYFLWLSWVIIGVTLFLLQAKFYYLFDYMAFNIPMLNSDIVGFGNLDVIIGHRGIYLSLGLGFIFPVNFYVEKAAPIQRQ